MQGLENELVGKIVNVEGSIATPPIFLTFDDLREGRGAGHGAVRRKTASTHASSTRSNGSNGSNGIMPGDVVQPLASTPTSVVVDGCQFANSRASGIILEADNALVVNNSFANLSSAAISIGEYWSSFSESPFGSNITIGDSRVTRPGLGHRTLGGGSWGAGGYGSAFFLCYVDDTVMGGAPSLPPFVLDKIQGRGATTHSVSVL